ncbi:splicing factor [Pichia californica]|uniref:Splicing factor n=1 Tax=Pichia californica TaxID=460514 RepID=A0A9P7BGA0_9ASCO|nr:splicing factor [[Candida] californica]KAG0688489.1 splicing factor [[Candida] californica]
MPAISSTILSDRNEQRKLVENLLGKGTLDRLPDNFDPRNTKKSNKINKNDELIDISMLESSKICKSFIVGKCPYDMLDNTKENMGKCYKLHIEKYKLIYENAKEKNIPMPRENYELDYMNDLEKFVTECDKRVLIAEERLDYSESDKQLLNDLARHVEKLESTVKVTLEELNVIQEEQHNIIKSIELNEKLFKYISEKDALSDKYSATLERLNTAGQQKLQVCGICGAYMSKVDNDRRLADHFLGKIHIAYAEMRHTLDDLKKKYKR